MGEDALIRLENLKRLSHSPTDLVRLVGSTYPYWRELLAGKKSFGEKAARNIEAKLGLPRGSLDEPAGHRGARAHKAEEPRALYRLPTNSQRVMGAIMDLHAALASVDKHTRVAAAALLSGIADNVEDMDYVERQAGKLVELLDPPAPPKRAAAAG